MLSDVLQRRNGMDSDATARRVYALIDSAPRSDYGIVFQAMRAVVSDPASYRDTLTGAYRHALAQFDGEEMTVATILREEIEAQGWNVEGAQSRPMRTIPSRRTSVPTW